MALLIIAFWNKLTVTRHTHTAQAACLACDANRFTKVYRLQRARSAGNALFLLKAVAGEFERAAVLRHRTHNVLRRSRWKLRLDFQSNFHLRSNKTCQMRHHLVGDASRVPAYTGRI